MTDFEWPDPVSSPAAEILRTGMVSDRVREALAPIDARLSIVDAHKRHGDQGDPACPMCVFTVDGFKTDNCRSCTAPIVWATTEGGKSMPVDAGLVDDGNVVLQTAPTGTVLAHVLDQAGLFDDGPRHVAHFVTCPDGDTWRSKRVGQR